MTDHRKARSDSKSIRSQNKYDATAETDRQVVERVAEIAERHRVPHVRRFLTSIYCCHLTGNKPQPEILLPTYGLQSCVFVRFAA
jgi:hypothetical protein